MSSNEESQRKSDLKPPMQSTRKMVVYEPGKTRSKFGRRYNHHRSSLNIQSFNDGTDEKHASAGIGTNEIGRPLILANLNGGCNTASATKHLLP